MCKPKYIHKVNQPTGVKSRTSICIKHHNVCRYQQSLNFYHQQVYIFSKIPYVHIILRRAAGITLLPCKYIPLEIQVVFSYPCIFGIVSKVVYRLIMCDPTFCSFMLIFSIIWCTPLCTHTVLDTSIYCNAKNIINFGAFLVQITASRSARVLCLRVSKLPLRWFRNFYDGYPLYYPAFCQFPKQIKSRAQTHMKPTYDIFNFLMLEKEKKSFVDHM